MPIKGLTFNSRTNAPIRHGWASPLACFLFVLCSLLTASHGYAATRVFAPVILDKTTTSIPLGHNAIIQKDLKNAISEDRIRATSGGALSGKISDADIIDLGYGGTSHWLAFKLLNNGGNEDWILDLGSRMDGRIGFSGKVRVFEMPLAVPGSVEKPAFYLNEITAGTHGGLYRIEVPDKIQKLIIVNVLPVAGIPSTLPLSLHSEENFVGNVQQHSTYNSFYCTMLACFALFFAFLAVSGRKYSTAIFAVYYVLLIAVYLLYDQFDGGIDAAHVRLITSASIMAYTVLCLFMTKSFCRIDHTSFSEKYIIYGLAGLNAFALVLSSLLPIHDGNIQVAILYGVPVSTLFIIALMSYAQTASGQIAGYEYFTAWIVPLGGLILSILSSTETIPMTPFLLNAVWYALLPQGVLLILAMIKKSRSLQTAERDISNAASADMLKLNRLKQTKEEGDHSRLLRVIEKEREMLADLRQQEAVRMEEMRQAKEIADEANRAKSAFLAVVSHEIRTPMTGIMGMVRLLLDSNISKQQKDYVMTIQESGDSMLGLLNDILDFEKIQRGKMDLENISFDLHRLIHGVITLMSGHAADKKVPLSARMDDDLPRYVKGDPTRLRQVLLNLMGNALKFTEKGSVTLLIKNMQSPDTVKDNNFMIYFAVTDTGIGISESAQKSLFSPFAQADSSIARKFGGSGLGLAISKGLIEAMGSSVNINSKSGEGSTFFFTLKMERGLSSTQDTTRKTFEPAPAPKDIKPLKILVVDDNTINRKVISSFLNQDNHIITTSTTAEDALQKIEEQDFDIVLMDIELPGMSGNEATKILRDNPDKIKTGIPVIALTGNVGTDDLEKYLADGMNGLISKPIDPDKLKTMVVEMAAHSFEREIKSPLLNVPIETVSVPTNAVDAVPPATTNVFDPGMLQSLKDAIGVDQLNQLLSELLVKTDEILGAMEAAAKAEDLPAILARAHELKGMAGNFGLIEISEIASNAEKKAKASETQGLGDLIGTLPAASARAQEALKQWAGN